MQTKLRIKAGPVEVDFEGSEEFVAGKLGDLLQSISSMPVPGAGINNRNQQDGPIRFDGLSDKPIVPGALGQMTVGTVAAKLGVKSGPDLILAAAAHLTLFSGKESFSRKEILDSMKTATAYYRGTYVKNLSSYLQILVRDSKLVERAANIFALPANSRAQLEARLNAAS